MTLSPAKKHMGILIITTIMFAVGAASLWRFVALLQAKKSAVISANQRLTSYEENKKIFSEESKSLAAITNRVTALEAYRITSTTIPELLSSLEALAQGDGVDFTITNVSTPSAKNSDQKLLIDFSAKGSAKNIDTFLSALSHQSYQIKFTRFSLFAEDAAPTDVITTAKIAPSAPVWDVLASVQIVSY